MPVRPRLVVFGLQLEVVVVEHLRVQKEGLDQVALFAVPGAHAVGGPFVFIGWLGGQVLGGRRGRLPPPARLLRLDERNAAMIPAIAVVPFCLLVPVLVIWLGERHTIVDKIGAAIICYAIGILVGNVARLVGLLPESATGLLDTFSSVAVAIASGSASGPAGGCQVAEKLCSRATTCPSALR